MNETNHPSSLATCTLIQDFLGVKDGGIYEAVVQLKQQLEAREREVMALVAENSALKKSEIEFNEYCRSECENEGSEWVDDFTETPVTSAALAEVGAKAIEKFIAKKLKQLEAMHPDTHAFGATAMEIRSQINELQAYVVELREAR